MRGLSHAHERRSVIVSTHDVSSWREHALNLTVGTVHKLVASVGVDLGSFATQVVAGCRSLGTSTGASSRAIVANALSTGTEETLDAVDVVHVLGLAVLLRLTLAVTVHF